MSAPQPLPALKFRQIFWLSFGLLGAQMSLGLENSQLGRLFQTFGASPQLLAFLFLIPPLTGMITQPVLGKFSDATWLPHVGRRLPYLIGGTLLADVTLVLLPNAGDWGLSTPLVLSIGATLVLLYIVAANACVAPFKILIGDMVNSEQKGQVTSLQSIMVNGGGILAAITPWLLSQLGIENTAPAGVAPLTIKLVFYLAALILTVCTILTVLHVHEYAPAELERYQGPPSPTQPSSWELIKQAPAIFWAIALVQGLAFVAFAILWTYGAGTVAANVYQATNPASAAYQQGGNLFGVLSGIYALAASVMAVGLARVPRRHQVRALGLTLAVGAVGFVGVGLLHSVIGMVIAFILIGVGWAGIIIYPLAFVMDAVPAQNAGVYQGLFNAQVCVPQIVASLFSVVILPLIGNSLPTLMLLGSLFWIAGTVAVGLVKLP
ncbi:MFS transporter [Fructilactobacillus myrtifloralis]|uniref:MFS transporter n=1 Tax=Fructilactobacillus myrtifloralis TaxID=2940301 RepID=A0ABY5BM62_9LACO|nr:MFS transporter [Fructilactobacillus myrtifloralis]USS84604.1 MFS transporter [Fructilactobacillus myrtifloralis]